MKRIKKLLDDSKRCRNLRKQQVIKWRIKFEHEDIPACTFFFIPTITYNPYPYYSNGFSAFNVYFLHWYIGIGEWVDKKEKENG